MEPSCHSRAATEVMGAERNAECGERSFPNALVDRTVAELLSILTNPKRTCETLVRGGTPIGCICPKYRIVKSPHQPWPSPGEVDSDGFLEEILHGTHIGPLRL